MERSCARAPRDPPAHAHSAPVATSLRWSATCVTIDKPMWIHYYQLKPTIDVTGRSVCCVLPRVCSPAVSCHTDYFHCPKDPRAPPTRPSPLCARAQSLATTDLLTISTVLPFPERHSRRRSQFGLAFSPSDVRSHSLHVFLSFYR